MSDIRDGNFVMGSMVVATVVALGGLWLWNVGRRFLSEDYLSRPPPIQRESVLDDFKRSWCGELNEGASRFNLCLLTPTDISELIYHIENLRYCEENGASLSKGYLLVGPPGTGKTYMMKLLSEVLNCSFFYMSAAQLDEVYVGKYV